MMVLNKLIYMNFPKKIAIDTSIIYTDMGEILTENFYLMISIFKNIIFLYLYS